ncbi:hypothetical protein BDR26DRAFT_850700 [Obelidium mucronatum]|nr:hypothetical protein BDR26DRAFT_850700 [Obelidium mucronatum]
MDNSSTNDEQQQPQQATFPLIDTRISSVGSSLERKTDAFTVPSHGRRLLDFKCDMSLLPATPLTPQNFAAAITQSFPSPNTPRKSTSIQTPVSANDLMSTFMFQPPLLKTDFSFPAMPYKLEQGPITATSLPSASSDLFMNQSSSSTHDFLFDAASQASNLISLTDLNLQFPSESQQQPQQQQQSQEQVSMFAGSNMDYSFMNQGSLDPVITSSTSFDSISDFNNNNAATNASGFNNTQLNQALLQQQVQNGRRQSISFPNNGFPQQLQLQMQQQQQPALFGADILYSRRPSVISSAMSSPYLTNGTPPNSSTLSSSMNMNLMSPMMMNHQFQQHQQQLQLDASGDRRPRMTSLGSFQLHNRQQKFDGSDGRPRMSSLGSFREPMVLGGGGTPTTTGSPASVSGTASPIISNAHLATNAGSATAATVSAGGAATATGNTAKQSPALSSAMGGYNNNLGSLHQKAQRKPRFKPQKADLEVLMASFENNPFPDKEERRRLAEKLVLEPKQILFWFQNRRAALKMNGIHVLKPGGVGGGSSSGVGDDQKLAPLMEDNGYFFVEQE